jgi:osmotically-inducible protein OsmY
MAELREKVSKKEIIEHLTWDNSVNASEVQVIVKNDTVQLRGRVPNLTAKMAAERDAYQVKGVASVENYLEVEFPPSTSLPTDKEIAGNVKNILEWDTRLDSDTINVTVRRGTVRLTGTVSSYREKRKAYDIAHSVNGVISVSNRLRVSPNQSVLDRRIEEDINNAFSRSVLIDENRIRVTVNNGIAHLSGVVANHLIKQEVHNVAMYTEGVLDVDERELTIG